GHGCGHGGVVPTGAVPDVHESFLQHLFAAVPIVQSTKRDAQKMRTGRTIKLLEGGAVTQGGARQQVGQVGRSGHGCRKEWAGESMPASRAAGRLTPYN